MLLYGGLSTVSVVAGCGSLTETGLFGALLGEPSRSGATLNRPDYAAVYGRYPGEPFEVVPFKYTQVDPAYLRQVVAYRGSEPAGTIAVDPRRHFLYLVEPGHKATRFSVGVGREGFGWTGTAQINMRRAWPVMLLLACCGLRSGRARWSNPIPISAWRRSGAPRRSSC